MILVTCSAVTAAKEANVGGGESGVMCRKLSEVEKIECIFSLLASTPSPLLKPLSIAPYPLTTRYTPSINERTII